ncbi:MAG: GNAT family N-acetyltransferase [Deltaproteobacteria bacterium]|nr:GNAT family N-acetyltransferase [Deltaproteobacteria bacterium]
MGDIVTAPSTSDVAVRFELRPGDIGYITWLHGILYAKEQGWNHTFEAYVAGPLAEFAKMQSARQRIWIAELDGKIVGTVAVVDAGENRAQLRWLLVDPCARGVGLGRRLVKESIQFATESGYRSIFLWTVSDLHAAGALYRSCGFAKTLKQPRVIWGKMVTEERYDLALLS